MFEDIMTISLRREEEEGELPKKSDGHSHLKNRHRLIEMMPFHS